MNVPVPPPEPSPLVVKGGERTALLSCAKEGAIPILSAGGLPSPYQRPSYDDDIRLGSFRPSRYAWAGEQRMGIAMNIDDSDSTDDHIRKEGDADFSLSGKIPLRQEGARSIMIIPESNHNALRAWGGIHRDRVKGIVNIADALEEVRNNHTHRRQFGPQRVAYRPSPLPSSSRPSILEARNGPNRSPTVSR